MFGFIGHRNRNNGRIPIVITGLIISVLSYFLMFINLPFNSNIGETDPSDTAFITSNQYLAVFTAFILGFSDSCFNTQVSLIKGDGNDGEPDARRKLKFEKKAKIGWN